MAEVLSPEGASVGMLDNPSGDASHVLLAASDAREGFWKIVIKSIKGSAIIARDERLPQ